MLETYGLHEIIWNAADQSISGDLVASSNDVQGRGIALTVRENGAAANLTGATAYLVWCHRATGERGTVAFDAVNAANGTFKVCYPGAMCAAAGAVDAQIMLSLGSGRYISTRTFVICVERVVVDGLEPAEDGFSLFVEAMEAYENAAELSTAAAAAANQAVADLQAAVQRGDFDGADGVSPTATGTQTGTGATITIADAIRGQNGSSDTYEPGDMAQAILDLTWTPVLKARALVLTDGTLEFNYLTTRTSTLGGTIVAAYDVPSTALTSAGDQPWYSVRASVTKIVFDSSFSSAGFTNCAYWFSGLYNLVEVSGFEALSGITNATYLFASCSSLESIYATSFTNSISSASMMFYGCSKLVGGTDGFVPSNTSVASVCKLGTGGVLTDPGNDIREWCKVYFYTDGSVVFTASGSVDANKTLRASGRLCVSAVYKTSGLLPGNANKNLMTSVEFASDMSTFTYVNMDYWLYSLTNVTSVSGIGNLANVREMQYAFASCSGLTSLDFRGFDPSSLTSLYMTFGGCSSLVTIYADSTWALPSSGLSGSQCFYNCRNLVGGNGTAWSSSNTGYTYMRIDQSGQAGYLTASA